MSFLDQSKSAAEQWIASPAVDETSKSKIRELIGREDSGELIDSFYRSLEFGTGRGCAGEAKVKVDPLTFVVNWTAGMKK